MNTGYKTISFNELQMILEAEESFDVIFNEIFPFGSINDPYFYSFMKEIGIIVKRYLDKDMGSDNLFLLRAILYKIRNAIFLPKDVRFDSIKREIKRILDLHFENEDLANRCNQEIIDLIDEIW